MQVVAFIASIGHAVWGWQLLRSAVERELILRLDCKFQQVLSPIHAIFAATFGVHSCQPTVYPVIWEVAWLDPTRAILRVVGAGDLVEKPAAPPRVGKGATGDAAKISLRKRMKAAATFLIHRAICLLFVQMRGQM